MDESIGPFGNPDGSRTNIGELQKYFIPFSGSSVWGGLATDEKDLAARVLVGRKGSGKTVYLRRLNAYASDQQSIYADKIQRKLPTTETIIKFSQWCTERNLTEKWMEVWYAAVLRSLVSYFLHNSSLKPFVSADAAQNLTTNFKPLYRVPGSPLSIYSQVTEIIEGHHSREHISAYLKHFLWAELAYTLSEIIKESPPIALYLDAVDEEFAHAPMYWLRCQKGLFYQVMRFLQDSELGGRLHIFICIRDVVLASIYRSEHQSRYRNSPYIRILNWNYHAIRHFLETKIKALDDKFFIGDPKGGKNIYSMLGIKAIRNEKREIDEDIEVYILRHTRLLPRDIVIVGNMLCAEIQKSKAISNYLSVEDFVRKTISEAARIFGNEQLSICANQIISSFIPKHAAIQGYSESYIGNQEYTRGVAEDLKKLLRVINKDRFLFEDIDSMRDLVIEMWGHSMPDPLTPFSILWQNGLLGYTNEKKISVFFSEDMLDEFNFPYGKKNYVLHSCLIDSADLQSIGKHPVITFEAELGNVKNRNILL